MKNFKLYKIRSFIAGILISSLLLSSNVFALSGVSPDVNEVLSPGDSIKVEKEVITSEITPKLDFVLLVDLSASYGDDIANIKNIDSNLYDDILAGVTDLQVGVTSFIDYPTSPWGAATDYPFKLDQDLTSDKLVWTNAIDNLVLGWGEDEPESQYTGLKEAAESISWRPGSKRVIAITTDASFHVPTDTGGTYPGPSRADTIAALNAKDITVIALKAPGSGAEMDDIAAETGGSVLATTSDSSDIADKILEGLADIPVKVSADTSDCTILDVSLNPTTQTVNSGETALFEETITVPNDITLEGQTLSCKVVFKDDQGNILGTQKITIKIPDSTAPILQCIPTTNPHGENIPKAGEKSKGQNEDGFYQIIALDNVDESVDVYINGFGPFLTNDKVKITEAPGAKPKSNKIGSSNGSADSVLTHLILDSDAIMTATDSSGNTASITCLVPPMPK